MCIPGIGIHSAHVWRVKRSSVVSFFCYSSPYLNSFFANKRALKAAVAPQLGLALFLLGAVGWTTFFGEVKFYQVSGNFMFFETVVETVTFTVLVVWFVVSHTKISAIILLSWQIFLLVANVTSFYFITTDVNLSAAKIVIPFLIFRLAGIMMLIAFLGSREEERG